MDKPPLSLNASAASPHNFNGLLRVRFWVLSDAGLTRGKRATGWWSIKPDLENAGATFIDEPAVTDGKIVTARAPIDLAAFVHAIDDLLVAA